LSEVLGSPGIVASIPTRPTRAPLTGAVLALACAVALAACGGSKAPAVANVGSSTQSTSTASQSTGAAAWSYARGVAYAKCMRAHGVTNFPDPGRSGDTNITGTGIDRNSPTFQSAQSACAKLAPGPGAVATQATAQQIKQAVETSECMRKHGIPGFPGPIATATPPARASSFDPCKPPKPGKYSETDYSNGILIEIPISIDVNSPAFEAAAKTCNFNTGVAGQQTGAL
jgi:hypothetical protein